MDRALLDMRPHIPRRTTRHVEPRENRPYFNRCLAFHRVERTHQGYRLRGRTPAQGMREALDLPTLPPMITSEVTEFEAALAALQPDEEDTTDPAA